MEMWKIFVFEDFIKANLVFVNVFLLQRRLHMLLSLSVIFFYTPFNFS